ncbi:NADH dehydrogenase [ubiquinone] 1 alpha subcomplex subunit 6 [Glycine soja]|nr:NADH dehydrogenase [ubiquinone] 1 alpha subcomplex subunit 6-like [Glycine soja]RZB65913.1 NADH dehydrogenase [ubiquinone] 1 alpha subcomplex subunit 6 [Glycine soja]
MMNQELILTLAYERKTTPSNERVSHTLHFFHRNKPVPLPQWKKNNKNQKQNRTKRVVVTDSVSERATELLMANAALRNVKVLPNSANMEEARHRVFQFFRTACRSLPSVMEIYNLYDVVSVSELRSSVSSQIRKNIHVTDPKVIDMLLFKGMEELKNVVDHSKQRHHIIGQYVVGQQVQDSATKDQGTSTFLKNFYNTNYF